MAECSPADSCEDGDPCTEDRCLDGACVSAPVPAGDCCASEALFLDTFDAAGDGVVEIANLTESAGWTVVETRSASPPASLYFGDPAQASYDTGERVGGTVSLPTLDLPSDRELVLRFRVLALIETNTKYDTFTVEAQVLDAAGLAETVTLLEKRDLPMEAASGFALVELPLTELAGQRVKVRLTFDTLDDMNNGFEGLYLDDLGLYATCPLLDPCAADADCADDDECTADLCAAAGCVYGDLCEEPMTPGGDDPIIEDPDPETPPGETDPCAGPDAPADCCLTDADCDDGDWMTVDTCEGATCVTTPNPDACLAHLDCDDGDACTSDSCDAGLCLYVGTAGPGCCVEGQVPIADFDEGKLGGIYVTDNLEAGVFWTPDKTRATSGSYSLYFGDPVTQTYGIGRRVKSSATTGLIEIPAGGDSALLFDLFKATRAVKHRDVLQVFVLRSAALLPAWSSKGLPDGTTGGAFQPIRVPLSTYAGQEVQLRFVFDSVDVPPEGLEGVYLDSIRIETDCD